MVESSKRRLRFGAAVAHALEITTPLSLAGLLACSGILLKLNLPVVHADVRAALAASAQVRQPVLHKRAVCPAPPLREAFQAVVFARFLGKHLLSGWAGILAKPSLPPKCPTGRGHDGCHGHYDLQHIAAT